MSHEHGDCIMARECYFFPFELISCTFGARALRCAYKYIVRRNYNQSKSSQAHVINNSIVSVNKSGRHSLHNYLSAK